MCGSEIALGKAMGRAWRALVVLLEKYTVQMGPRVGNGGRAAAIQHVVLFGGPAPTATMAQACIVFRGSLGYL